MIELRVLGSVDLRASEGQDVQSVLRHPKRLALLAYLAAARPRGFHRRDALLTLFWPDLDQPHARNALRQAVHFLRNALGRDVLVPRGEEELALDPQRLSCDVAAFEEFLDAGETRSALNLYRGDLLAAFHVSDALEFERWLDQEREHLRRRAVSAALALAQESETGGDALRAARWASRALEISPYDEGALRRVLRLLDQAGDRAEAMHEYDAFARRLLADLSLAPAPETASLAEEIRARVEARRGASHDVPLAAAGGEPPSGARAWAPPRSARVGWRLALGAAAIALLGGIAVVARSREFVALDPELVAVAPFDVFDPELELWHEGLVDVLSRNLDGAGAFRTVSPTVVIRRWGGHADRASAEGLGRRTGAGVVVFGQLLRAGPDSVRLRAAVLDTRKGLTLAEIDRTDQEDRIDRLADSLSVDVIRSLTATTSGDHIRLYSVGTKSLPALKAFLQGERFLRRFALDSAIASYDRAITLDSTFALALRRAGLARGWSLQPHAPYFVRAAAFNHGLSPRDSLLVLSDSGAGGPGSKADHPAFRSVAQRGFAILEEAARRYPEDPEIWYHLGESRFHAGFVRGTTWDDARVAFDRAIALDSQFAPAYIHPVEIALNDNDPDAALRYVRSYLAISSVMPEGAAMGLLGQLLDPQRSRPLNLERELEVASPLALYRLAFALRSWPDADESQIRVARRIVAAAPAHPLGTAADAESELRIYRSLLANVHIFRGHLHQARVLVGNGFELPFFMDLAALGAIPSDTVEMVLAQWLQHSGDGTLLYFPFFATGPCYRTLEAAHWWASRRDTANLRRLARRQDSDARAGGKGVVPIGAHPVLSFVRGALALAQGDTVSALNRFLTFPDSLCPDAQPVRDVRFRLLAAVGRDAEAAAVFDRSHERRVPLMLERARLAERLGDRSTALHYYQFVIQAWQHADPELQPVVAEARAALSRLGEERRP
jgi:serine/threonine-protein kinase